MKNIKKASCNNQSIKRFLSPQPSNIPCKRQCKQMDMENKCNTQKGRDICIFSSNPIKQPDEIEKRKNNLQLAVGKEQDLNTNNKTVNKFDWNSFVRDPGELQESRYPVTLNTFKSMTHSLSIVNCILEDIKIATSLDFINDELMKERVLKNFFIQFYENPQIRNIYKLETKPCPTFLKKKIMQIPTLEIIEVKDSTTNAATVAAANIAPVEAISKSPELRVPEEQSLKTAPDPISKPAELERVEAQSSKSQENEIPTQQINAKSNIALISKSMLLMDDTFLRRHVSRNTQQIEKLDIILERIYAELLPRKQSAKTKEVKPKPTKVHEISDEVCIDISNSPVEASAVIAEGQRIEQAKQLFFTEYSKKNTLAYALRFHNGLKRRIISAILEMSIDEFKKYTKIHDVPEMYDDPKLLHDCYNYAIKAPQIWPVNLYMQLCDIFEYLQTKGVSIDNLEDISPMLLHWTELAVITNFDEIVQWNFYRCKGEKFQQFTELEVYRKKFYEKCWMHNTWLREVPKLHVEVQKELTTGMEVVEKDNVSEVAAANEAPTRVNPANTTEHTETATKDESANAMNVECAEQSCEAHTNNTISVPTHIANAAHAQAASAGHLAKTNEAILSDNPNAASSVEQAITLKENQNTLPEATVNVQTTTTTTTTTTTAVVEIITNSNEKAGANNLETEAQQRIQAAQKLYFYEVEKSYTLPYLLRLHNGLKRRILHAILNMTYTEFKEYTHIHKAAEIYENNELLQHCYDFVVRKPQVWPVNLYMRLVDLYKFLKIKGLTLTAADLTHVSPKLLHWHDLIETTNYDYLLFWDYYRRSGKKMSKNNTRLNTYRQKFYEKCWLYDSWIWHTPKICENVLTADFVPVAAAEDKENANFEIAVMTHALEERDEETTETEEGNRTTTEDEEITDATVEPSPVQASAGENVVPRKNATGSVSTVDAEIQTSQHLLLAACANSSAVSRETEVPAENPNPVMMLCKAIKKEKLSPLDKLQFNLTKDEENYECVPVPDDIVDLEGSISANASQEELLLPLSNSESLGTHDNNLLLLDSTEEKNAEHTAQCTENMETESLMEQQPSLELNNEQTQLMPECIVEMEVEVQTTTTTTHQPLVSPVTESNETPLEQPQIETQTKTHAAPQTGEICPLQEQKQQEAHIVVQQALTGEQVHVPGFISREVKEELLQEVQETADNCTEQHKQKQQRTKQLKSTGTEVATALTRIIEAHKLAQQQKQQHFSKNNAQTTVETQAKQQQEQTLEKSAVLEKQQHSQQQRHSQRLQKHSQSQQQPLQKQQKQQTLEKSAVLEKQQHSQQYRHSERLQKHSQSQQQPLQKQQHQPLQQQQSKTATEHQQKQKQQQQAFAVKIPLPKSQQQRKKQQQQISALKRAKEKEPAVIVHQTVQQKQQQQPQKTASNAPHAIQQQETVTKAPQIIQQQHDAATTVAEGNNTQKKLKSTPLPQKQQPSNEQRTTRQQTPIQQQQTRLQQQQTPLQQQQTRLQEQQTPLQQQQTRLQQQQTPLQQQQGPLSTVVIPMSMLQQQNEFPVEGQAPQTQQQQIRKSLTTQKTQIIAKPKVLHTEKQLEQLAKPSQVLHTKTHVQQELQEQELDIEKQMEEMHQDHQLVPQNVVKAVVAQIQSELQQSPQQLTQTALPSLLVKQQQHAINNQNQNELAENPQMIESMKQNQPMQQQTTVETLNASKPSELEFLSQQLQQQFHQPQLILQRTSTQIQEQVILRPTVTLSQDSPINLPPFVQLASKQTTNATKKKTVATKTKTTTRKAAKLSDYVPQLTHVFQPLPVALNTKKAPTLEPTTTVDLPPSNTNVATTSHQQLTPAVEEQFINASNTSLSPPNANAMLLTLPATLNATSTSASNASYVYTLSGDSSLFNSSELLKALESYQLQRSQQQQQQQQQQQLTQSEQSLQEQQFTQSEQSLQQQVQWEQGVEFNCNQLQVTQQQQPHYQAVIQMSQPLAFVESVKQQQEQEQQQNEEEIQQQLQQHLIQQQQEQLQQQQEQLQQQLLLLQQQQQPQSQHPLLLQQHQQQEQQQLILQQLLQEQQLNLQQPNQAAIQIQQPLLLLDHAEQQQQLQPQQSYQLLLQQPQQHHPPQPTIYQLVDVNQAPHTAAILAGEQVQQYLQLSQTPYFTQLEVQGESATQAQQSTTAHLPLTITNELLQVNVWFEHNYAMAPLLSPALHLTSLPSPKGVCRMRSRPLPKPFFYRRLEKIDYFRELTALNIAEYQLQCTSLGKSYLQAQIRTTHLRTVVSGDILAALLPRCAPDLLKHLQLVLQYLGEFHFNTWEQRQQRKVISKCSQRTLHTLCAHILLLFFQYSSPFQSKCLDMATGWWQFEQRDCLGVETALASTERTDNMLEDLSLAIDPCILAEMAALKRNL